MHAIDRFKGARRLGAAGVAALALIAPAAYAQDKAAANPDTDETIVVTGYRAIIKPVEAIKRDATQVLDTITQAEIERLPDRSLAEVLDRVPGVSTDRGFSTSQARTVTLRGFDARYNSMEIDGNLIWNSSRNNRGAQLDVFPSSVISQVNVFKTVLPDQDANSIGGHIELRTLRAFDGGTQTYVKARAAYGLFGQDGFPATDRASLRFDAAGKFTFGPDRRFGAVLGGEYQRYDYVERYDEVTSYAQIAGADVVNGDIFGGVFPSAQRRKALFGKLEMRSENNLYAFVSASYFDDNLAQSFNRGGTFITGARVTGATAESGNFTAGTGETYFERYRLNRETALFGSGLDVRLGARASLALRGAYTRYNHDEEIFRSERFQVAGLTGAYSLTDERPRVALSPASLALAGNPVNWLQRTGRAAFDQQLPHRDNVYNVSATGNWNAQPDARGFGLIAGAAWRRLDRAFDQTTFNYTLPAGRVYRLSDVLDPGAGAPAPDGASPTFIDQAAYIAFIMQNGTFARDDATTTDYRLQEDVLATHASLTWATPGLRVAAGFRVERTDVDDSTASTTRGIIAPEIRRSRYSEFLPNVQLTAEPVPGFKLRAAYTETIGRPDFADFANGVTVSFNSAGVRVVSGANPYLGPRQSKNYDASIEYYRRGGYLSLGLFRKDLYRETFRQVSNTFDAAGVLTAIETIPLNTGSAQVDGLEASAVFDRFAFLPGILANFGMSANYTLLDGRWNVVLTDGAKRAVDGLRNQPKWLGNAILSYRQGRFGANLAYRLRGRTFTGAFGATPAGDVYVDRYRRLDAQATLRTIGAVTLFAEARNLTDSDYVELTGLSGDAVTTSTSAGRSFWFGVQAKY